MGFVTWLPLAVSVLTLLVISYQVGRRVGRMEGGLPPLAAPPPTHRTLRIVILVILAAVAVWLIVERFLQPAH